MIKYFKIYVACILTGWAFRLFWDLNHVYNWMLYGDWFFGVGIAVMFFGCSVYIDSTIIRRKFDKRWQYLMCKMFTRFFLFTCISNLCDEMFYDPFVVSFHEWATAFFVFSALYAKSIWDSVKHLFK